MRLRQFKHLSLNHKSKAGHISRYTTVNTKRNEAKNGQWQAHLNNYVNEQRRRHHHHQHHHNVHMKRVGLPAVGT